MKQLKKQIWTLKENFSIKDSRMENGPGKGTAGQKTMAAARRSVPDSELPKEDSQSSSTEDVVWSDKPDFKHPGWTEWQYPVLFSFGVIAVGFVVS